MTIGVAAPALLGQLERELEVAHRALDAGAVRLVDDEDVGDLHDAGLDRLDLVAQPGHRDHRHRVDGAHHVDLVLADADGLDQDRVEAGGVEQVDGVARGRRQAAHRAAGRHRADEDVAVGGEVLHAHAIAEQRAAGERAGGIDGDDAHGSARARDSSARGRAPACSCPSPEAR